MDVFETFNYRVELLYTHKIDANSRLVCNISIFVSTICLTELAALN